MHEALINLGVLSPVQPVVLIVDDQPDNLHVLAQILAPRYQVRAANSGAAALHAATKFPLPDLVILDVMMPGMDGFETLRQLQSLASMQDVPVIFITALNGENDEEQCFECGATDFISKPLRPHAVQARVKTQIDARHARRLLLQRADALENEVQSRLRDFHVVQDVTLRALASLAETRDNETGNHILRTQAYVATLAQHLRDHPRFAAMLGPEQLRYIVKAAPLHDIGKVGIPDKILLKPGRLTADEFAIMRTHAQLGADALNRAMEMASGPPGELPSCGATDLLFLEAARDIALCHHERWDGSGYPNALAGDAIPVSARLMALADVFDALISRRVYKEPIPLEQVVDMIHEGCNRQFDPDVEAAFRATLPAFARIAQDYADPVEACLSPLERMAHQGYVQ